MTPRRVFAQTHEPHNGPTVLARLHHYGGLAASQSRLRLVTLLGVGGLILLNGPTLSPPVSCWRTGP
jgi:hypothetical protein